MKVPNATELAISGDISISLWVKADDFDNGYATVLSMRNSNNGYYFERSSDDAGGDQLKFYIGDGADKVGV